MFLCGSVFAKEIDSAQYLFQQGQYEKVLIVSLDGKDLYWRAQSFLMLDRYEDALQVAMNGLSGVSDDISRAQWQVMTADIYFYSVQFEKAYEAYKTALASLSANPQRDYVLYRLIDLAGKLKRMAEKTDYKSQISKEYLESLKFNFFTVHTGKYTHLEKAQNQVQRLSENGFDAYYSIDSSGRYYYACVGRFPARKEALMATQALTKAGFKATVYP